MHQLTSYADGFDELGAALKEGVTAGDCLYMPGKTPEIHAENPR